MRRPLSHCRDDPPTPSLALSLLYVRTLSDTCLPSVWSPLLFPLFIFPPPFLRLSFWTGTFEQVSMAGDIHSIILNNHDDLFIGSQETFDPPARRAG